MIWDNITSGVIGFLVKVLYDKVSERSPKVVFNVEPARGFNLAMPSPQPNMQVWQHSLHLTNWGKTPATNIVITHDYLPFNLNFSQHALNKCNVNRNNKTIVVSSLAPKELIVISYLDFNEYSTITYIIYDQGIAAHIPLMVTIPPKRWVVFLLRLFAIVGLMATVYWAWSMLPMLWQKLAHILHMSVLMPKGN
jgi:uncharacterized repeat protein (TIGR01451 family)